MRVIYKAALAVFKDKKMLQVRTNKESDVFYTLGGKIEESSIKFLSEFEDVAHGKDALLNVRMYQGKLIGDPKASSEIVEIGWFDTNSDQKNLSEIAKRTIFPWLKKHGYIN